MNETTARAHRPVPGNFVSEPRMLDLSPNPRFGSFTPYSLRGKQLRQWRRLAHLPNPHAIHPLHSPLSPLRVTMSPKVYGIVFALLTGLFWGMYGPALQTSRVSGQSPFKPFILIGVAYLLIGILGGIVGILATKDNFHFAPVTVRWGFIAGSLGAFGALTLTLALFKSRAPDLVMPIVFGGATLVSVAIGLWMKQELLSAHPMQYIGTLAVVIGVVLVQAHASHGPAKPVDASTVSVVSQPASPPSEFPSDAPTDR